ncbi:3-methyl-2-oxobutanoate hydroxymethyltransferase [Listeria ivanovii]|uniref:3-methyl-2-oxobutanoate hydroxymethyltransferase n=1 Tax=Listeria ivanovii (strain ATCC BAA-678 / PAM 55) TaxID=881621 RepID=G2ZC59_LISIP|nr:3-methyl-2-oxobutanoate hydroxymethyltransferase [Listeria ivanovii]AHI56415.1 3-methyl-2-oxobutanoate hydroxymethyltransferase [Listeria ivanovii WSLC3009]AIS65840.1 3-methyl-2-oxobutanoate hydroxymethyltransferase [Listeria ivanovii subsp. ivanovii]MBC1759126.1 3-methyl-2-oxobutanoate hydroxymethyltransferase [Listeria ivanovii]MBK3914150.1 3-methyl-2-oxobutanoate hydroxymethyltransferase [Listeria ivanovii subsp. ivanovii]MBK3921012.1 3-methyl-2-oxobutanoate hydroxymethyltransferase [Lis
MKRPVDFFAMKENGEKITMITAYDYPSAKNVEQADADMILVGDSLGMVVLGYDSTVPVTVDDMIHHTKAVKRGAPNTFVVTDMPFMTYHGSIDETIKHARQIIQESGAHAVKLEGAGEVVNKIARLTEAGAPVVAHLGLTPQSVGLTGSYKVRAKSTEEAQELIENALAVEAAGAIAIVLEAIPRQLAEKVTKALSIPTIGIGAGIETDGQVLVYHDIIGYGISRRAKFVKAYADIDETITPALSSYVKEVKETSFPEIKHSFTMAEEDLKGLYGKE